MIRWFAVSRLQVKILIACIDVFLKVLHRRRISGILVTKKKLCGSENTCKWRVDLVTHIERLCINKTRTSQTSRPRLHHHCDVHPRRSVAPKTPPGLQHRKNQSIGAFHLPSDVHFRLLCSRNFPDQRKSSFPRGPKQVWKVREGGTWEETSTVHSPDKTCSRLVDVKCVQSIHHKYSYQSLTLPFVTTKFDSSWEGCTASSSPSFRCGEKQCQASMLCHRIRTIRQLSSSSSLSSPFGRCGGAGDDGEGKLL